MLERLLLRAELGDTSARVILYTVEIVLTVALVAGVLGALNLLLGKVL